MSSYDNTNTGALFKNDKRESDSHPTHTGSLDVEGVEYWISAWVNESKAGKKYFSIKLRAKDAAAKPKPKADYDDSAAPADAFTDEIPF
jgi:uncharacterized protein (DUF736 family)